jgi:nicotinate-nucleotide pyrophosphorylase (carboxylating)
VKPENNNINKLVTEALEEDLPNGDVTTDPLGCSEIRGLAQLVAKQDLVVSGVDIFNQTFKSVDPQTSLDWAVIDGAHVRKNAILCQIKGPLSSLLKAERTALNFLGHLSGVATQTSLFVKETQGTSAQIIDTRKTTPLLRFLEKAAVRHGGGKNHRFNLSDAVLIKENHIRAAGGITAAIEKIRQKHKLPIEVEVTNPEEIDEALKNGVEKILLDNMSLEETARAVKQIASRALIEASGNMTLDRIQSVAKLGVNFISVGSLTHSAPNADLSLLFERTPDP